MEEVNFNLNYNSTIDPNSVLWELVVNKEYPSETLSFMGNHQRLLSNWDANGLLWQRKENKHRLFSFVEVVWICIIKELRNFGCSLPLIKNVRNFLLSYTPMEEMLKKLENQDPRLEDILRSTMSMSKEEIKRYFKIAMRYHSKVDEIQLTILASAIVAELHRNQRTFLLINSQGTVLPYFEKLRESHYKVWPRYKEFLETSHIVIPMSQILGMLLPQQFINKELVQAIYSEKENELIKLTRNPKVDSIIVKFDNKHEIDLLDSVEKIKASPAQRLSELLLKDGAGEVTMKSKNGKILCVYKTARRKLK